MTMMHPKYLLPLQMVFADKFGHNKGSNVCNDKIGLLSKIVITISITSANTLRIPPARRIAKGTLYSTRDVP